MAGFAFLILEPISSPLDPTSLRSAYQGMLQVIGVLTGFVVVTYVFWNNGTVASFAEQAKSLPSMCTAMQQAGATHIRMTCARGLVGVEVIRDITQPFKPFWAARAPAPRPGDELKVIMDGYSELFHGVLRRAYIIILATVLSYSVLMTLFVLGLSQSDSLATAPSWVTNTAVFAFVLALVWVGSLLRLLLRPGSGVAMSSTKENPDGTYTLIAPEGL